MPHNDRPRRRASWTAPSRIPWGNASQIWTTRTARSEQTPAGASPGRRRVGSRGGKGFVDGKNADRPIGADARWRESWTAPSRIPWGKWLRRYGQRGPPDRSRRPLARVLDGAESDPVGEGFADMDNADRPIGADARWRESWTAPSRIPWGKWLRRYGQRGPPDRSRRPLARGREGGRADAAGEGYAAL